MKKKTDLPPPPKGLSSDTARLWSEILDEYKLEPADLSVLEEACFQRDSAREAREVIRNCETGRMIKDRFDQWKEHPAVAVEQNATRLYFAGLRQLGLGLEPAGGARLPDPVGKNLRD